MFGKTREFLREVKVELQKASWPWEPKEKGFIKKYKELWDSTLIVVIAMVLMSGFVACCDIALQSIMAALTS